MGPPARAGTQLGSTTSADGRYTIANVVAGSHRVQVRMIGYSALERTVVVVSGQVATANFELSSRAVVLDEVVAVGYGTQRRESLTGAVDQVSSQALENRPMARTSPSGFGTTTAGSRAFSAPGSTSRR